MKSLAFVGANHGLALHPVNANGGHIPGEGASCFASFWIAVSVYPGPRGPSSSGYMAVAESWVM